VPYVVEAGLNVYGGEELETIPTASYGEEHEGLKQICRKWVLKEVIAYYQRIQAELKN